MHERVRSSGSGGGGEGGALETRRAARASGTAFMKTPSPPLERAPQEALAYPRPLHYRIASARPSTEAPGGQAYDIEESCHRPHDQRFRRHGQEGGSLGDRGRTAPPRPGIRGERADRREGRAAAHRGAAPGGRPLLEPRRHDGRDGAWPPRHHPRGDEGRPRARGPRAPRAPARAGASQHPLGGPLEGNRGDPRGVLDREPAWEPASRPGGARGPREPPRPRDGPPGG